MTKQCDELKGAVERLGTLCAGRSIAEAEGSSAIMVFRVADVMRVLAALPQDDEVERLRAASDDIAGRAAGLSVDDGIFDIARAALSPIQSPRPSGEEK